jgi:hypothetical protein
LPTRIPITQALCPQATLDISLFCKSLKILSFKVKMLLHLETFSPFSGLHLETSKVEKEK